MSSTFILTLAFAIVCAHICAVSASPAMFEERKTTCIENAERVLCGKWCAPTCRHPEHRICGVNPALCTYDCRCKDGFVKDEKNNECVRFGDCPQNVPHH